MKKLCLLSGMMAFSLVVNADITNNQGNLKTPGNITEEERQKIEQVQWGKITRQEELARPATYKMLDSLIRPLSVSGLREEEVVDWTTVFAILDSMRGVIDVNEYCTPLRNTLLGLAAEEENIPVIRILCEKYNANPYRACYQGAPSPLDQKVPNARVRDVLRYYARNF